jgi:hypothetical protein
MFPSTGIVTQAFHRAMKADPEALKSYTTLQGNQAKKAFRTKWAESQLEAAEKVATKTKAHTLEQSAVGVYLPFRRIWDAEGADFSGYKAYHSTHTAYT